LRQGVPTKDTDRECDRILSKTALLFRFLNQEVPAKQSADGETADDETADDETAEDETADDETERYATKIRERTENLIRALKENIDALSKMLVGKAVSDKFAARLREVLRTLPRVSDSLAEFARHDELVYWLEQQSQQLQRPQQQQQTQQPQQLQQTQQSQQPQSLQQTQLLQQPQQSQQSLQPQQFQQQPQQQQTSPPRLTVLKGIPKNLGEKLFTDLWSNDIPIILTSGTLSSGTLSSGTLLSDTGTVFTNDFTHIRRKTGLDRVPARRLSETSKPSPFNHRENSLLYFSENVPFPDNSDDVYIAAVADETEKLVRASHGHAAVLFTSYKAMDKVWEILARRGLPYPMFRLGRGGVHEIDRFKRSGNGILFAAGALWEGIDIPGDALSLLIIVRLPFAVPDPISEYEQTLYANVSEYIASVVVPEMLIKLKQGCGRLLRTVTDKGVVALFDLRVSKLGAYRTRVLNASPDCAVTDDIAVVEDFYRANKPPEYFA